MNYFDLLFSEGIATNLHHFSTIFFSAFEDGAAMERRESSNYVGGEYFTGKANGISINVSLSDDLDSSDFPYLVEFSSEAHDWNELNNIILNEIKTKFSPKGFTTLRLINSGMVDEKRITYP